MTRIRGIAESITQASSLIKGGEDSAQADFEAASLPADQKLAASEDSAQANYEAASLSADQKLAASSDHAMQISQESGTQANVTFQDNVGKATLIREASLALAGENKRQSVEIIDRQFDSYVDEIGALSPPWRQPGWQKWQPAKLPLPMSVIGSLNVTTDENHTIPAIITLPQQMSMLLHARGAEQSHVNETILLRYLTSFPPGKLEFTLIDPVGLGRNVAALMHLADHRPQLINDRAWIEPSHIEKQLAAISEQMQTIIQKYLRTTFATMEEYNIHAEQVAELYRIVVVNNFPANFNSEALRHLVSIVTNGPKCGVHTMIAIDDNLELPYRFNIADLEHGAIVIRSADVTKITNQAVSTYNAPALQMPGVKNWEFFGEEPPDAKLVQNILEMIGNQAQINSVVEVPFNDIAPAEDKWWTGSSRDLLTTSIGVSGARKHQAFTVGTDTEHNALLVGRVGSGKSTLLHATIMNLALTYSPEELELYLLDFKKGVEFETYAVHKLPHARAIAVESEREFAQSILEKLDHEMTVRGELFRAATQEYGETPNIKTYRAKTGKPLPRIVLLVDEFHEFFTENDNLATQAQLLIERLVRQGRSFGIHVMLCSQSLGGQHTLGKVTMDQMTIRIALQCSDTDARLILADDNPAARLLDRPGEAIYNDRAGLVEGNNQFQTAWLSDENRDNYLTKLTAMANERFPGRPEPVIFEGSAVADVAQNPQLTDLLKQEAPTNATKSALAWLGDPIAIKAPVTATLGGDKGATS